jgi:parallel beta-helix repeat protein
LTIDKPLTIIGEKDIPVFSGGISIVFLTFGSGASGSNITDIEITSVAEGILVDDASNCSIYGNIMDSIGGCGIVLEGSNASDNAIYNNIFQDVPTPINLTASGSGNTIYGNAIVSQASVTVDIGAGANRIYGNSMVGNQIQLNMTGSNGNVVYHNNFLATTQITVLANGNNRLDNGSASGGNYWSVAPSIIGSNNTDRYPLVNPWPLAAGHCVGVACVVASKSVIGQGFGCNLTVCLIDKGEYNESSFVRVYANATMIGSEPVSAMNVTRVVTVTCVWSTVGLVYGNYTISAYMEPATGQNDMSENNFILGTVKVTIPGDINGDFQVNLQDLVLLAQAYGSTPGSPNWNPNADITGSGTVGLQDLVILAQHYGQHYP